MSLSARITQAEAVARARREVEDKALYATFKAWRDSTWSEVERQALFRVIVHSPQQDQIRRPAELEELRTYYPPPTDEDRVMVDAAWARMPADLAQRLRTD